jgi:hypothetical protein
MKKLGFSNRGLFSDHFLKVRLPQWKEWQEEKELSIFRSNVSSLYKAKESILPNLNEAQTEKEFIQPIFDLLGYADSYIVQTSTRAGKQVNRADCCQSAK